MAPSFSLSSHSVNCVGDADVQEQNQILYIKKVIHMQSLLKMIIVKFPTL